MAGKSATIVCYIVIDFIITIIATKRTKFAILAKNYPMAEELHISKGRKEEKYALLYKQIVSLVEGENDTIANMANIAAMIQETFRFWWTGFYRVVGDELVLGPFQGPLACSRIKFGRGVCVWYGMEGTRYTACSRR